MRREELGIWSLFLVREFVENPVKISRQMVTAEALQLFRMFLYADSSLLLILLVGVMDSSVADDREELLQAARA